jgi:hypothetical protein
MNGVARSQAVPREIAGTRTFAVSSPVRTAAVVLAYTLPPEDKPKTHWPWWLRVLAVIFVLVFIRIVAGSMRSKPSGPNPS